VKIKELDSCVPVLKVAEFGRVFGTVKQAHTDPDSLTATIEFASIDEAQRCQRSLIDCLGYETEVVGVPRSLELPGPIAPPPPRVPNQVNVVIRSFPRHLVGDVYDTFAPCGVLHSHSFEIVRSEFPRHRGRLVNLHLTFKLHRGALLCQTLWSSYCTVEWGRNPMVENGKYPPVGLSVGEYVLLD